MPLYMPELYEERATRQMTSVFGGLNRGARIPDGEWADMQNLTSDQYPLMATRDKRYHSDNRCCPTAVTVRSYRAPVSDSASDLGLLEEYEGVVWLDGVTLRFGGKRTVDLSWYGLTEDDAPRQRLLNFGAYVIVYPAMIYVNTVDMEDVGRIQNISSFFYRSYTQEEKEEMLKILNPEALSYYEIDACSQKVRIRVCDYEGNGASYDGNYTPVGGLDDAGREYPHNTLFFCNGTQSNGTLGTMYRFNKDENRWYEEVTYLEVTCYDELEFHSKTDEDDMDTIECEHSLEFKKELFPGDVIRLEGFDKILEGAGKTEKLDGNHIIIALDKSKGSNGKWFANRFRFEGSLSNNERMELSLGSTGEGVNIQQAIPSIDYMCEADNRLWGCRYGDDGSGNFVNEIYCSARGDFFRWIQGAADNDDSPVTFSIGTDGPWTGCVSYGGAPTFFKERCMHRVGGYGASGFYVQDTPVRGVMSGASDSLAVVNGVLYYYADGAVMAYDGSLPVPVSEKLSPLWKYKRAVGSALYGKYYLSLYDEFSTMINDDKGGKKRKPPSECALYVLDTERGLWHKEDDVEITCMATGEDDLVFVEVGEETVKSDSGVSDRRLTYTLSSIRGTAQLNHNGDLDADAVHDWSPEETKSIGWSATSGVIGLETPDKKYLSKISIRLRLSESDGASAWVEYDSEEGWKPVGNVPQTNRMRTVTLPIIPKRCDHMRLKLEGTGTCKVYSITKTFTEAEDE